MLLRLALLAAFLCAALQPAHAQSIDPEKEAAILELIEVTGAVALGDQFADQMLANLRPMFEQAYRDVPGDVMDEMMDELRRELAGVDMAALVVPVYDRHLSTEDIQGLLDFYRTPLGQRVIAKLPVIMQESMAAGQAMGEQAGRRAAERVVQRLEERGYSQTGRM